MNTFIYHHQKHQGDCVIAKLQQTENLKNSNSALTPVREQNCPFHTMLLIAKGTPFRISKVLGQTLTLKSPFSGIHEEWDF